MTKQIIGWIICVLFLHEISAQNGTICGNSSFVGPTGIITSPGYPEKYKNSLNCTYVIDSAETNTISLIFNEFHLEGSAYSIQCTYDWLEVRCTSKAANVTNRFENEKLCGLQTSRPTITFRSCLQLTLKFVTDSSENYAGFSIRYETAFKNTSSTTANTTNPEDCGNLYFNGTIGTIFSPNFPRSYPTNIMCEYFINGNQRGVISLKFAAFDLEGAYFRPCMNDWLMIECLDGQRTISTTQKFCGHLYYYYGYIDQEYSRCSTVKITFFSDSNITRTGFHLIYAVRDPDAICGKPKFSEPSGVISANYSTSFSTALHCTYTIYADRQSSVSLKFLSVPTGTGYHSQCYDKWLMISCVSDEPTGSSEFDSFLNKKLCGTERKWPNNFTLTNCHTVLLDYVSAHRSYPSRPLLQIEYTIQTSDNASKPDCPSGDNCSDISGCGNTLFTDSKGVIVFPNSNTSYRDGISCTFTISANLISSFQVHVLKLELESNSSGGCSDDWIMIGCLLDNETDLNFSSNTKYCGRSIGRQPWPRTLAFSKCRNVKLYLRSGNFIQGDGFRISYSAITPNDAICGNTLFTNPSGFIRSPHFPLSYPKDLDCTYTIPVDKGKVIILKFLTFDLEDEFSTCRHDWLKIRCRVGANRYRLSAYYYYAIRSFPSYRLYIEKPLCLQRELPPQNITRLSYCDAVELNFISDYSVSKGGFEIEYSVTNSSCGETSFTSPTGNITSPGYPNPYPVDTHCIYTISANRTSVFSLEILSFELDEVHGDFLMIDCLSENSEDEFDWYRYRSRHFSGRNLSSHSKIAFGSCRTVKLEFVSDASAAGLGFRISYLINSDACGNTLFTDPSGTISLPKTIPNLGGLFSCNYSITTDQRNTVSLTVWSVSNFNDSSRRSCPLDWLQIICDDRNGSGQFVRISHQNCLVAHFRTVVSFLGCSSLRVLFHADFNNAWRAFRVAYQVLTESTTGATTTLTTNTSTTTKATTKATISSTSNGFICAVGCTRSEDGTRCNCPVTAATFSKGQVTTPLCSPKCSPYIDNLSKKISCNCSLSPTNTSRECGATAECKRKDNDFSNSTFDGQHDHSKMAFGNSPTSVVLLSLFILVVVLVSLSVAIFFARKRLRSGSLQTRLIEEENEMVQESQEREKVEFRNAGESVRYVQLR